MSTVLPAAFAVLLSLITTAVAADLPDIQAVPELQTRYTHYYATYRLNPDATHVETHDWGLKILDERALQSAKHVSVSYRCGLQKAEVLRAYTLKPDGRRIEVPSSDIQVDVHPDEDRHAAPCSDTSSLRLAYPEVEVGDTLEFAYQVTQREAIFPGQFSVANQFSKTVAFDDLRITLDAPSGLWFQYEARQMAETRSERDGRIVLQWTLANPDPVADTRRDWSVFDPEQEPGFAVSTFHSHAEIAQAYAMRARPKAAVTPAIRTLANAITQGKTQPREQARALYDWVATHIGNAGHCLGAGAVVPHDSAVVLENRLGDCKDHATLLQALLSAKNIASTQALINADNIYRLPKIPVVAAVNHVINFLPGLNLFVDSTSERTPFGWLPAEDQGKPALLVDGTAVPSTTPGVAVGSNRQHVRSVVRFDAHGSIQGEIEVDLKGAFAISTRAGLRHLAQGADQEIAKQIFKNHGRGGGTGRIEKDDPLPLSDRYHYRVRFDIPEWLNLPGPAAMAIFPLFPTEAPLQHFLQSDAIPDATVPSRCSSGTSVEEYVFHFPASVRILSVPKDLTHHKDFLRYEARYRLRGRTLTVKRMLDDRTPYHVCPPGLASIYKDFIGVVAQNVNAQVVYR